MPLKAMRMDGESWRECVRRYAEPYGMEDDALDSFDNYLLSNEGKTEADAASFALYTWDLMDYVEEETPSAS